MRYFPLHFLTSSLSISFFIEASNFSPQNQFDVCEFQDSVVGAEELIVGNLKSIGQRSISLALFCAVKKY
ncbi:hypothetical protein TSUD_369480 [Trifolium subterraneum]|uniref:Uncharacterized protein n=1 Tax=Trifolium subterraneum TaxID=3900 RepID=A0A2Z6NWR2_TRISU|nr:hypothetical protein TSUD_369480 [Trifolium subterraneum]